MIDFFKLHVSDYGEALLGMSDESVGKILKGLIEYSLEKDITPIDDPAVSALFTVMKLHIDRDENFRKTKAVNGKKGGAPFGNKNSTKNNQKQPRTTKNNQKQPPIPIPIPIPIPDNINSIVSEIVDYLNEKTKSHYQPKGKTEELINGRLNDGYTTEDFKKVIDNKVMEWQGSKYEKFLRPSTLFAPGHFEEYLNQKEVSNVNVKQNRFNSGYIRSDYDMDALEKKLTKN